MSNVLMIAQAPTRPATAAAKAVGASSNSDGFAEAFKDAVDKVDRPIPEASASGAEPASAEVDAVKPTADRPQADLPAPDDVPANPDDNLSDEPETSDLTQALSEQVVAVSVDAATADVTAASAQDVPEATAAAQVVDAVLTAETPSPLPIVTGAVDVATDPTVETALTGEPTPQGADLAAPVVEAAGASAESSVRPDVAMTQANAAQPDGQTVPSAVQGEAVATTATAEIAADGTTAQVQSTDVVAQADAATVTDKVIETLSPKVTAVETAMEAEPQQAAEAVQPAVRPTAQATEVELPTTGEATAQVAGQSAAQARPARAEATTQPHPAGQAPAEAVRSTVSQSADAAQPIDGQAQPGTATDEATAQQAVETTTDVKPNDPQQPTDAKPVAGAQAAEAETAAKTGQADPARPTQPALSTEAVRPTETADAETQAEPVRTDAVQLGMVQSRGEIAAQNATDPVVPDDGVNTARVVNDLVRGVRASVSGGLSRLQITLDPPELGRVTLNLMVKEGQGLRVEIETRNDFARQAIEGRLDELHQALQKQGQTVLSLDVRQRQQHGAAGERSGRQQSRFTQGLGRSSSTASDDPSSAAQTIDHAGYRLSRGAVLAGGRYNLFV